MKLEMTHARNQDGFALIEAIVSAAVLAIIALAVLAGIDGATASTARERARAVAASLAEQDQERLRSMRFDELTQLVGLEPKHKDRNKEITVDRAIYNVNTEVTLRVDSGTPTNGCGANPKQAEYLRIVTTVNSAIVGGTETTGPGRIAPVTLESLVSPPVSGSLVVKVLDAKGVGVVDAAIQATAKSGRSYPGLTNAQGCAAFVGIESGEYTVTATKSGYVDRTGKSPATGITTVTPNLVNVLTLSYDRAAHLAVNVRTLAPGTIFTTNPPTWFPSKAADVSDNSAETNTLRNYTPASPSSSIDVPNVFPFTSGYSFFTGRCGTQSPAKQTGTGMVNYFSTMNPAAVIVADPNKTAAQQTAIVYEPSLNLRVNSTSNLSAWKVYAVLQKVGGDTCAETQPTIDLSFKTWPTSGWGSPPNSKDTRNWIGQAGSDFDPGLPFGSYRICVQNSSGNWNGSTVYDNTATHRTATTEISATSGYGSKPSTC